MLEKILLITKLWFLIKIHMEIDQFNPHIIKNDTIVVNFIFTQNFN